MSIEKAVRVRFAPSPTGPLHIGGVRTALYNYLLARKLSGTLILRIEDTDQSRFVPGAEQYIIDSLKWVGIVVDEGPEQGGPYAPYRQSERKSMYAQYAYDLIENGWAYYAFDTEDELDQMRKRLEASKMQPAYDSVSRMGMRNSLTMPADEVKAKIAAADNYVIRIKLPRNKELRFFDLIRGWVLVNTSTMDDKVLLKSDGMPTYHLANVVDDYLMKISHVIRGEEWLPSAPLHVMLYRYLGWEESMPAFAHLPLLLKPEGHGKLSKRDGDRLGFPVFALPWKDPDTGETISSYSESGYYPEAVANMLALLGWHPSGNQELFSMEELIAEFSLERVSKSGAKFDLQKAFWFNHQYLQTKPLEEQYRLLKPLIDSKGYVATQEYIEKVILLMREKVQFAKEIIEEGYYFFVEPRAYDEEAIRKKWKPDTAQNVLGLSLAFGKLNENADAASFETIFKEYCESRSLKTGEMMQPLRLALSGATTGPPIWDMLTLIGRDSTIARMQTAAQKITATTK